MTSVDHEKVIAEYYEQMRERNIGEEKLRENKKL
jgi:hypothetical protein